MMHRSPAAACGPRDWRGALALSLSLSVLACQDSDTSPEASDSGGCVSGKCDDPEGGTTGGDTEGETSEGGDESSTTDAGRDTDGDFGGLCFYDDLFDAKAGLEECEARADAAFNPNRGSFQPTALRWSCADTSGRPADQRGQEYCEYFAIVNRPGAGAPSLHGHSAIEGGMSPMVPLSEEDITELDAEPFATVGACVFTSWNSDVPMPSAAEPESVHGIGFSSEVFRMDGLANSREAADILVDQCMNCPRLSGNPDDPEDPYNDDFTRGCFLNGELNTTTDRKSDSVICAAAGRMGECGCELAEPSEGRTLPGVVARDDLGFPLGTWSGADELPTGCRYHGVEGEEQNIVVCDIFAHELITHSSEIKSFCAELFADDVVVHVPIAAQAIVCDPSATGASSKACGETPWVVEP